MTGWALYAFGLLVHEVELSPEQIGAGIVRGFDVRKPPRADIRDVTELPRPVRVTMRRLMADALNDGYPQWDCDSCSGDECQHRLAVLAHLGQPSPPENPAVRNRGEAAA